MPKYICKCSQCGAELNVLNNDLLKCPMCGSKEYIKEPVTNNYTTNNYSDESSSSLLDLLKAGEQLLNAHEWQQALDMYERAVSVYHHDYRCYYGRLIAETQNFTQIFTSFDRVNYDYKMAHTLAPDDVKVKIQDQYFSWERARNNAINKTETEGLEKETKRKNLRKEIYDKYVAKPCTVYRRINIFMYCLSVLCFFIGGLAPPIEDFGAGLFWVSFLLGVVMSIAYKNFEHFCKKAHVRAVYKAGVNEQDEGIYL